MSEFKIEPRSRQSMHEPGHIAEGAGILVDSIVVTGLAIGEGVMEASRRIATFVRVGRTAVR
jgi:hypothetical protein